LTEFLFFSIDLFLLYPFSIFYLALFLMCVCHSSLKYCYCCCWVSQRCCRLDSLQPSATKQRQDRVSVMYNQSSPASSTSRRSNGRLFTYQAFLIGSRPGSLHRLGLVAADTMSTGLSRAISTRYVSCTIFDGRSTGCCLFSSHWSLRLFSADLTTARACWLGCLPTWFAVFSRYRTRQHGSYTEYGAPSILPTRPSASTGLAFRNAFNLFKIAVMTVRALSH